MASISEQIKREDEQAKNVQISKMKQLIREMYGCLTWQWEPHAYMQDGCDFCPYRRQGQCGQKRFAERAKELGIDVRSGKGNRMM